MCFTTVSIGHILLPFFQNIWSCFLSLVPTRLLYYMSTNTSMCISVIRYYTKFKAQKSQIVDSKHAFAFIKYNKMFSYLVFITACILLYWFRILEYFSKIVRISIFRYRDVEHHYQMSQCFMFGDY